MLVKDVEPIGNVGENLLNISNYDEIIDKIIEKPLRNSIKIFRQKGIKTIMSSCNKNNILKFGERRKEKEDIKGKEIFFNSPTFEDAGKGYAWIMLDYESLADENKDMLFKLEERKNELGENIGEKGVWFVQPCVMGNLFYQLRCGKINYEEIKDFLEEDEKDSFKDIKLDKRLKKFEEKSIILKYNNRYPALTVIIRMPIDENTTLEEVDKYFCKFAESFKEQNQEIEKDEESLII